jgi:hypothetical protein
MRLFIYIGIIIFCTSCSSFLEEADRSLISYDEFFLEERDAQFAVDAIYSHFDANSFYAKYYWLIPELCSDIGVANVTDPDLQEFSNFTMSPTNKIIESIWSELYAGIQTCNFAIKHIPAAPNAESEKIALLAEARFFRALFHFDLVRFFGDVPLELDFYATDDQSFEKARLSRDSVLTFLAQEFNALSEELPESTQGRPVKVTAQAYLVKAYVLLKDYPNAYLTSRMVLSSLALLDDYADVFKVSQNLNSETIFAISFNSTQRGPMNSEALPESLSGEAITRPTAYHLDAYDLLDRRLSTTFGKFEDQVLVTKYWDESLEPSGGETANDLPLLRLPDIMLLHAEIINEVRKSTNAEAIQLMNSIRARARFDGTTIQNILPDLVNMNYDQSKEAILLERQRELAYEGYRWFDLVRTGELENKVALAKPSAGVSAAHYLFPIPQREIEKNSLLVQNPGY